MRKDPFENYEYYHIFNRGVDHRDIFIDERDYERFLMGLEEYNNSSSFAERNFIKHHKSSSNQELSSKALELSSDLNSLSPFVNIISYCLNRNHYHLLLQQNVDGGISKFMHKLNLGYTNYFNKKYERTGSLFEGTFKSVKIQSDQHLAYIFAYVTGNAKVHNIVEDSIDHPYSAIHEYISASDDSICSKDLIIDMLGKENILQCVNETCGYICKERSLRHYILD